jgi:hypothetical protein
MIDYIEKLFPETFTFIRRLSVAKRLLLLLTVVCVPLLLTAAVNYRTTIIDILIKKVELPVYGILIGALIVIILALALWTYLRMAARRSMLLRFTEAWIEYFRFMEAFIAQIETNLLLEGIEDTRNNDDMRSHIRKYQEHRNILRELLFSVGETRLAIAKSHSWEELKLEHEIFRKRDYQTPFSFLLDFRNPISAIHSHGQELWKALHICDEFLEYLSYRYSAVKKLKQARRQT